MKLGCNLLTQFFVFDFAVSGGAVGTYRTGIQLPRGAIVFAPRQATNILLDHVECYFCLESITGAPDLGLNTASSAWSNDLWAVTGAATLANNWEESPTTGCTNSIMDDSLDIILIIRTNPMTAGKLVGYIEYFIP